MVIPITKLPLWSKCHPKNDLVIVYDNFEQETIFAEHRERVCLNKMDKEERYLCLDYKTFMKNGYKCYDINAVSFWLYNKPKWEIEFDNFYSEMDDFTYYYPYKNLIEKCRSLGKFVIENRMLDYEKFTKFHDDFTNAFYNIERNGIGVNTNFISTFGHKYTKYIHDKKVFQNYNFFTTTSRPSNAINNLNFAALTNEQRKGFSPLNDVFVDFDFDAYHPRLIAELVGYEFPKTSVHDYLSDKYGVDTKEGKTKTFQYMYGGIPKDVANKVEFLKLTKAFITKLWLEYIDNQFIKTKIYGRILYYHNLPDMNPMKLFNYYIQAFETERNVQLLCKIHEYLYDRGTNIVHYNYDSFLFDYSRKDGVKTIYKLKEILENNGYVVKTKAGHNYGEMKEYEFNN